MSQGLLQEESLIGWTRARDDVYQSVYAASVSVWTGRMGGIAGWDWRAAVVASRSLLLSRQQAKVVEVGVGLRRQRTSALCEPIGTRGDFAEGWCFREHFHRL